MAVILSFENWRGYYRSQQVEIEAMKRRLLILRSVLIPSREASPALRTRGQADNDKKKK